MGETYSFTDYLKMNGDRKEIPVNGHGLRQDSFL